MKYGIDPSKSNSRNTVGSNSVAKTWARIQGEVGKYNDEVSAANKSDADYARAQESEKLKQTSITEREGTFKERTAADIAAKTQEFERQGETNIQANKLAVAAKVEELKQARIDATTENDREVAAAALDRFQENRIAEYEAREDARPVNKTSTWVDEEGVKRTTDKETVTGGETSRVEALPSDQGVDGDDNNGVPDNIVWKDPADPAFTGEINAVATFIQDYEKLEDSDPRKRQLTAQYLIEKERINRWKKSLNTTPETAQ